jgi:hypothetical protein
MSGLPSSDESGEPMSRPRAGAVLPWPQSWPSRRAGILWWVALVGLALIPLGLLVMAVTEPASPGVRLVLIGLSAVIAVFLIDQALLLQGMPHRQGMRGLEQVQGRGVRVLPRGAYGGQRVELTPEGVTLSGGPEIAWTRIRLVGPDVIRNDWVIAIGTTEGGSARVRRTRGSRIAADPAVVLQLMLDAWTHPSRRAELATGAALREVLALPRAEG